MQAADFEVIIEFVSYWNIWPLTSSRGVPSNPLQLDMFKIEQLS